MSSEEGWKRSPLGIATFIYFIYKIFATGYELILIASTVSAMSLPVGYHRTVSAWDRYELTVYLWSQSSVATNVAGMVMLFALYAWRDYIDRHPYAKETLLKQPFRLPCCGDGKGEATYILGNNQGDAIQKTFFFKIIIGFFFFVPFLAPLITHTLPAVIYYPWMMIGFFGVTITILVVLYSILLLIYALVCCGWNSLGTAHLFVLTRFALLLGVPPTPFPNSLQDSSLTIACPVRPAFFLYRIHSVLPDICVIRHLHLRTPR